MHMTDTKPVHYRTLTDNEFQQVMKGCIAFLHHVLRVVIMADLTWSRGRKLISLCSNNNEHASFLMAINLS